MGKDVINSCVFKSNVSLRNVHKEMTGDEYST